MRGKASDPERTASGAVERERPWVFRTYSGHTSARASNELFRTNLRRGQTGLSVAFDLPTQTGYDGDHPLARGEVGKVGVPVAHIEDMETLFRGIPLDGTNTSMTINATAAWILALYVAAAERRGVDPKLLQGTTQNDIIKEYLSRGTYVFPPEPSLRLTCDLVAYAVDAIPRWNPINVCSYHLQEAGATPVQEIAYSLATAVAVLDALSARGDIPEGALPRIFGRISFFLNSGIRFVEEICKGRAMVALWDRLGRERYHVADAKLRRFRYGIQVNSLGLTAAQPENNVIRIVLETLGVTFSKKARCRALQLPAWNEALGLPRPWDQQWSLRIQQILAFETDLLEYEDLFDGSPVVEAKSRELEEAAWEELQRVLDMGGAVATVENAYMKQRLVESHTRRLRAIESGERTVVGVNEFTEAEPSPLTNGEQVALRVDESAEREEIERLRAFRGRRNQREVEAALANLRETLQGGGNVMPPSIRAGHAGVTTGEWTDTLRRIFGEYRAPTGLGASTRRITTSAGETTLRRVRELSLRLGRPPRILVAKPGLDGHSNGAEQIAVKARDVGMEVIYQGIRLTPDEIVKCASEEDVDLIGLSILSGSHEVLLAELMEGLARFGLAGVPVVVGGIIPKRDAESLRRLGVRRVYTPKDFDMNRIMEEIVELAAESEGGR